MLKKEKQAKLTALVQKELQRALGCTEPIAITYAVAQALELLDGEEPTHICVGLSTNMIKNAMGAAIPHTGGLSGIELAALCGIFGADSKKGLEIFSSISKDSIKKAKSLVGGGLVEIKREKTVKHPLFIKVVATSKNHTSSITIADEHTYVVCKEKDGHILYKQPYIKKSSEAKEEDPLDLTLNDVVAFVSQKTLPLSDLFKEAVLLSQAISDEGLKGDYGLSVVKLCGEP